MGRKVKMWDLETVMDQFTESTWMMIYIESTLVPCIIMYLNPRLFGWTISKWGRTSLGGVEWQVASLKFASKSTGQWIFGNFCLPNLRAAPGSAIVSGASSKETLAWRANLLREFVGALISMNLMDVVLAIPSISSQPMTASHYVTLTSQNLIEWV